MGLRLLAVLLLVSSLGATAQGVDAAPSSLDSDHDGLSDALENTLIQQFQPHFIVSSEDCSIRPARFTQENPIPIPLDDDGTIYAQAFPHSGESGEIELHFYHLWRRDCGQMGHALDTEHVAVLLAQEKGEWQAKYWYAAAHEDTVCDASQITRAAAVNAVTQGPKVWISAGKHASFLDERLCTHGCGGDRCELMEPLRVAEVINLGEAGRPMNGAIWTNSSAWPLQQKLERSDFPKTRTDRLKRLPEPSIAWANPSKRPVEVALRGGNAGVGGAATGARATGQSLALADDQASIALDKAQTNTGNALSKSFRNTRNALGKAAKNTGKALGISHTPDPQ